MLTEELSPIATTGRPQKSTDRVRYRSDWDSVCTVSLLAGWSRLGSCLGSSGRDTARRASIPCNAILPCRTTGDLGWHGQDELDEMGDHASRLTASVPDGSIVCGEESASASASRTTDYRAKLPASHPWCWMVAHPRGTARSLPLVQRKHCRGCCGDVSARMLEA